MPIEAKVTAGVDSHDEELLRQSWGYCRSRPGVPEGLLGSSYRILAGKLPTAFKLHELF